jgi:acetyl-CoA C-acetyltransferase
MTIGIRDRVAVVGMGCTKFGERWNADAMDLMVEAAYEAY